MWRCWLSSSFPYPVNRVEDGSGSVNSGDNFIYRIVMRNVTAAKAPRNFCVWVINHIAFVPAVIPCADVMVGRTFC